MVHAMERGSQVKNNPPPHSGKGDVEEGLRQKPRENKDQETMTIKQERAAQLIQEILGELLMFEVTDPALQAVNITEVRVDREIEYADIYVFADDDEDEVMAGLTRARGFMRHELAQKTRFRKTPELIFHWDATIEHAARIDELLDSLHLDSNDSDTDNPDSEEDPNSDEA
jgi:ribosome-binding factor A